MRHILLCIMLITISAAPSLPAAEATAPQPLKQWRMAFVRHGDIWTADGDGSGQKRIIKHGLSPAWSPDRKAIAFARGPNVWIARADGTGQRQLTRFPKRPASYVDPYSDDIDISWRPGSGVITFSHADEFRLARSENKMIARPESPELDTISIFDVSAVAKKPVAYVRFDIRSDVVGFTHQSDPAWSPNGKRLAFIRNGDIWLAQREEGNGRPGWEVTRIAPVALYDGADYRADTSNYMASHPAWSPDGRYLAYAMEELGHPISEVHLMRLESPEELTIPNGVVKDDRVMLDAVPDGSGDKYPCYSPSFSPDGKLVAFHSGSDIWTVSIDGKNLRKLIANGSQPAW